MQEARARWSQAFARDRLRQKHNAASRRFDAEGHEVVSDAYLSGQPESVRVAAAERSRRVMELASAPSFVGELLRESIGETARVWMRKRC